MPFISIDTETIPDQRDGALEDARERVKVPATHKKPETIEKYIADHADEAWRKTALDGTYGELITICWAVDDGPINSVHRPLDGSEADMLTDFWAALQKSREDAADGASSFYRAPVWVGHNVSFDLKMLHHRSVINRTLPSTIIPHNAAVWHDSIFDTMAEWAGVRDRISLANLSRALGLDIDDNDIKGSEVWDAVRDGRMAEVVRHCQLDVSRVRAIHKRLTWA